MSARRLLIIVREAVALWDESVTIDAFSLAKSVVTRSYGATFPRVGE